MGQPGRRDIAEAGRGQVVVPAIPAGPDQRPRTLQALLGRELLDDLGAGGAVDVQDIEVMPGGQADVGLGVAGLPGQDPGPIRSCVLDPVGHEAAHGVLGDLAAARVLARAGGPCRRSLGVIENGLEAAVGEGVVQGQDGDAAGGIADGGVAELPTGPAHRASSVVEGRWRWRKVAALLRPQPAASARVRAVQAWPSGRGWA